MDKEEKFYVYILRSSKNSKIYTGFTTDINRRLNEHNKNMSGYTKNRGPWSIVWVGIFENRLLAESFEKYLKSGSGIAFARKRLILY
ncbi:MAG: GIY-YIG nuclease family protein [Candidatus Margulisbacteria bacterium]|nr:GIY-YIG nuclease family protein [Candidatus Margulisiibacteriota bacterium]